MKSLERLQEPMDNDVLTHYFGCMPAPMALYETACKEDGKPDLRLLYANRSWLEALGATRETAFGSFFSDLAPNDSAWIPIFTDVALGRRENYITELYSEEVGLFVHSESFSPCYGQVITFSADRTKFIKSEAEQSERENKVSDLFEYMPSGFCIFNAILNEDESIADIAFNLLNIKFEAMLGFRTGSLQGHRLLEVYPDYDTKFLFENFERVLKTQEKVTFLLRQPHSELTHEVSCYPQSNYRILCNIIDATDRFKAMAELKQAYDLIEEQNQKNQDMVALVSDMTTGFCIGKLIRDEQGKAVDMVFEMANVAFDTLEGFIPGTLPGKRLFEVRDVVPHFCKYVEAVEQRKKITFTKQIKSTGLILEAMCFSSYDDTLICIENDVTEQVKAINELKQAYTTIEEQNRKNKELITLVSDMTTGFCIGKLIRDKQGKAVDMVFEMANVAFDTLEGFTPGTLPGKRLFEVRDVVPHFCKYVEAVEQRNKITFIKPIKSTGLILEAMCFSSYDDTLICIENDVTERVEAERKLHKAYDTIEEQNQTILSSINYASRIQRELLPKNCVFENVFSDYSILWSPRDIVSGDIYWIKSFEAGTVLCVCDCTGHGTPGALLTMLVISAFEDVVTIDNCQDTAQILWSLEQRLVNVFGVLAGEQEKLSISDINNGCDLAILFITKDKSVTLSAGRTHVFVCNGEQVTQIKGQRLCVGEGKIKDKKEIETVKIQADQKNKFYIASDGLFDQMGGELHCPFGYNKFKNLIMEHHEKKLPVISDLVWEAFENYRGDEVRRDDIELISFQI